MNFRVSAFLALLASAVVLAPAEVSADPVPAEAVRTSIERGLAYLATEAPAWRAENKCAACHHTPMMIWATNEAKAAGYPVNEVVLAELTSWALADDEIQHVFPGRGAPPPEADGVNLEPAFLILAVEKSGEKKLPDPLLQRFFADITKRQSDDGSFTCYDRRPPIGQFPEAATLLTRIALASPLADRTGWADAASVTEKVDAWIDARPALDANQYRTLRLLLTARLGKPASELQPMIDELLAQQAADGGWIQLKGLTSDAYSTGQTLYALLTAGLRRDHAAVEKAVGFLVAAQNDDGSFKVTSYVHGVGQPGARNPRPITCSASGWAVMALSLARPAK